MHRSTFMILTLVSLIFSSCTSIHKSHRNGSIDISIQSELKADVDVDMNRKLRATAVESRLFGFIPLKSTNHYLDGISYNGGSTGGFLFFGEGLVGEAKSAAAYKAVRGQKNVDVLVAPQYAIKVKNVLGIYKKVTATVTGYAGRIRRIKKK